MRGEHGGQLTTSLVILPKPSGAFQAKARFVYAQVTATDLEPKASRTKKTD